MRMSRLQAAGQDSVLKRTDWGSGRKHHVVSRRHRGKARGWAAGGECTEEAEKRLSCLMLWGECQSPEVWPRGISTYQRNIKEQI